MQLLLIKQQVSSFALLHLPAFETMIVVLWMQGNNTVLLITYLKTRVKLTFRSVISNRGTCTPERCAVARLYYCNLKNYQMYFS